MPGTLPTPPYMRVRIRRFNKNLKIFCCLGCDSQSRPWDGRVLICILSATDLLKAGFSSDAIAASSDRTVEPVVLTRAESGKLGLPGVRWFPRDKPLDGSSLFFIVRPFLFRLDFEAQYYGLC